MKTSLDTSPVIKLLDLDSAKDHLNIDHTNDDFYILGLIESATAQIENITRRGLLTQTWKAFADGWPDDGYFTLPFGWLQSVTSVKYTDSDGDETTWGATNYISDTDSDPGRVVLGYNKTWPTATLYPSNPIEIEFVCGKIASSSVPQPIKSAALLMIGDAYSFRESIVVGSSVNTIPGHIMNLLWSYRLFGY